jgi:hypothetical protein
MPIVCAASFAVLDCAPDRRAPSMTSVGPACSIAEGTRVIAWADLAVGKSEGDGCEGVGGNAFDISPGLVSAVATWSDARANLKIEIWTSGFGRLLATGLPPPGQQCASTSTTSEGARVVVRVCHTRDSAVPPAVRNDVSTFTPYHLELAQ